MASLHSFLPSTSHLSLPYILCPSSRPSSPSSSESNKAHVLHLTDLLDRLDAPRREYGSLVQTISIVKGEENSFPKLSCTGLGFYGNRRESPWRRDVGGKKVVREKVEGPWNERLPVDEVEALRWEEQERVLLLRLRLASETARSVEGSKGRSRVSQDVMGEMTGPEEVEGKRNEEGVRMDRSQEISTTSNLVQPILPRSSLPSSSSKSAKKQTLLTSSFPKSKSFINTTNSPKVKLNSRSESTPQAYKTSITTLSQATPSSSRFGPIAKNILPSIPPQNPSTSASLLRTKKKLSATLSTPIIQPQRSTLPREVPKSSPGPHGSAHLDLGEEDQEETQKEENDQVDFERPEQRGREMSLEEELLGEVGSSEFGYDLLDEEYGGTQGMTTVQPPSLPPSHTPSTKSTAHFLIPALNLAPAPFKTGPTSGMERFSSVVSSTRSVSDRAEEEVDEITRFMEEEIAG